MVRRQTWQVRRFEIFESARHFQIESNRDVRFQFESNLEASQVPSYHLMPYIFRKIFSCTTFASEIVCLYQKPNRPKI